MSSQNKSAFEQFLNTFHFLEIFLQVIRLLILCFNYGGEHIELIDNILESMELIQPLLETSKYLPAYLKHWSRI